MKDKYRFKRFKAFEKGCFAQGLDVASAIEVCDKHIEELLRMQLADVQDKQVAVYLKRARSLATTLAARLNKK